MMLPVIVNGQEFRYYDNGGPVMTSVGNEAVIIGSVDEDELKVSRYDSDEERARSEGVLIGRIRAMALSWQASRGQM